MFLLICLFFLALCVFILLIGINLQDLKKDGRSKDKVEHVRIPY